IANVDLIEYGLEILEASASVKGKSPEFLLNMYTKSFNMCGKDGRVDQVTIVDVNELLEIKEDVENEIIKIIAHEHNDLFSYINIKRIVFEMKLNKVRTSSMLENQKINLMLKSRIMIQMVMFS